MVLPTRKKRFYLSPISYSSSLQPCKSFCSSVLSCSCSSSERTRSMSRAFSPDIRASTLLSSEVE